MTRLIAIMARLRDPATGCPWDLEQTFATIAPYTIEEAYEVAEAIAENDMSMLESELGDLLFQVVFHARMADEAGAFDFAAVAASIADKMERRHPHVFAGATIEDAAAQTRAWEDQKAAERAARAANNDRAPSLLDDIPASFPALMRAHKLQKRAARVGFDWTRPGPVFDKVAEEIAELRTAFENRESPDRLAEEMGDILFACVNLARHLGLDPESSLRSTNVKFDRRFRLMERAFAARGRGLEDASSDELEEAWREAKAQGGSSSD